jgi:hypothetical protein
MYARKTYSRTQDRKTVGGKIDVSREELADFRRKYGADKTLRDLLNYDRTGKLPGVKTAEGSGRGASAGRTAAAKPAGRAEIPGAGPYKAPASTGEGMSETRRNIANIASALPAARAVGMAGKAAQTASAGRAAAKAAPRVEPRVGRPVTTKLDDAAAAFSRPQARQASKDTGYTREAMPAKTAPKPTAAPKPREEVLKRQAAMREGRKSEEDYVRDVIERGAEMGMKRGGTAKAYAKGGSVKGGGCETRSKKTRFI